MEWAGRHILVTGGASFIGSHLVERLVREGAEVAVADNFSSGLRENISSVLDQVTLHVGDLRDRVFAKKVIDDVDLVFHLAASHGGRGYIATHPADCSSNMVLDGVIFDAANSARVEKVCFASSACVYPRTLQARERNLGEKRIHLSEDMADPFVEGRALADEEYGWAKLMGEMALRAFNRQYGLKGVSCRIFTAYGPRENETHAIMGLIAKAFVKMDPYEVWGSGEQDRNFTYVEDIVEGMIKSTERIDDASPINIGSEARWKISEVTERIFAITGFRPNRTLFDTTKPEGVFSRAADLRLARERLQWEPRISIDAGLKRTVDWYWQTHHVDTVAAQLKELLFERVVQST